MITPSCFFTHETVSHDFMIDVVHDRVFPTHSSEIPEYLGYCL